MHYAIFKKISNHIKIYDFVRDLDKIKAKCFIEINKYKLREIAAKKIH